jgi:hypothetical protein
MPLVCHHINSFKCQECQFLINHCVSCSAHIDDFESFGPVSKAVHCTGCQKLYCGKCADNRLNLECCQECINRREIDWKLFEFLLEKYHLTRLDVAKSCHLKNQPKKRKIDFKSI